jgi:RNA polymerase sigma-70 factor (ECF subfamily)
MSGGMGMLAFYLAAIESQEDRDLFTDLYYEYREYMFYVANKILKDEYAAENIVHDAFVRMIENLEKINLRNCHKTKGLIGIIVDGLAKNEYKRRKRMSALDDEPEVATSNPIDMDARLIQQEQYARLLETVEQLDSIYRNAFLLRYDYEFSVKEIAQITEATEDNVRQRLHRAKLKLRELLAREGQEV